MNLPTSRDQELIYHIDGKDRLCEVGGAWSQSALANDCAAVMPERVLGHSLWDFIGDANVRELYRQMLHRVRQGKTARFDYRCDTPELCRQFQMTIRPADDDKVEFVSRLLWEEQRPHVDIFDLKKPRGEYWVRVCSWCQNLALPDESWAPVEEAVERLGLLAEEVLPKLTHGICPPCHLAVMAQFASPNKL